MDINAIDNFFLSREEPDRGCFMALREIIKAWDVEITEHWKYSVPFYYFKGKPFCYLYKNKTSIHPYIGIARAHKINHPDLFQGSRKKMKVLEIDVNKEIPTQIIYEIFDSLKGLY